MSTFKIGEIAHSMCACVYLCVHTCVCVYVFVCVCVCECEWVWMWMFVCVCMYMYAYMCLSLTHVCVCIRSFLYYTWFISRMGNSYLSVSSVDSHLSPRNYLTLAFNYV